MFNNIINFKELAPLTVTDYKWVTQTFTQKHMFHLVTPSPWPMNMSWAAMLFLSSFALWFHGYDGSFFTESTPLLVFTFSFSMVVLWYWMKDVILEATYLGDHNVAVQKGLVIGFSLFIVNEVMFFVAIFWAYLHSALVPTVEIGNVWPPFSMEAVNPYEIPLVNTALLLVSAMILTASHHNVNNNADIEPILASETNTGEVDKNVKSYEKLSELWGHLNQVKTVGALSMTIILAITFTYYQYIEYSTSSFSMSDSVYGSAFFFATGFHGIHVAMGTIMLLVAFVRFFYKHHIKHHFVGYENAILYYHFVDIVWLLLFLIMYWWAYN